MPKIEGSNPKFHKKFITDLSLLLSSTFLVNVINFFLNFKQKIVLNSSFSFPFLLLNIYAEPNLSNSQRSPSSDSIELHLFIFMLHY